MKANSYRTILRSSYVIGAASVANILVGLVRMKIAAVLLGPAGIGLLGLLQNLMGSASVLAGLGLNMAGTRQIAEAAGASDPEGITMARRALFWGTLALALVGGTVFFLLRDQLAARIAGDPRRAGEIGWLALGVALTVASASQSAFLNGLRRIGDLARLQIGSAILSMVIGVGALLLWGGDGMVLFLIGGPLASFLLGHWYVSKLDSVVGGYPGIRRLVRQWRTMIRLGAAFMVGGLIVSLGFLAVRSIIQHGLGAEALGQYQAAWAISMTYLGFVLSAMATDYYPRLTATISDRQGATRIVNEQTEVALLLGGPVLVAMLALAPLAVYLLYTPEFAVAAVILRWQILGDILKLATWPLGFVLLASGAATTFMITESAGIALFVLGVWLGLPLLGVEATGVAFLVMYAAYLPLVYWLARRRIGFAWTRAVVRQMALLGVAAGFVVAVAQASDLAAALAGCAVAVALGLYGLGRLGEIAELKGPVGRLAAATRRAMTGVGVRFG